LYIFLGDKPEEVIQKYHRIIGQPALPPYWTLGWQQCRFGYRNDTEWSEIINKYDINQVPLDVMYTDIDYLEDYRDFTYSKYRYAKLPELVEKILQDKDRMYVPIIDIAIPFNTQMNFNNISEY
jgi:alpha-glucosidase (family GH31 glycosyl hydrolase)